MSRIKDMKVVKGWWKRISRRIGPGVITGAADDDPSVMYGLMSPPLIAVVLHVANNEKVMGKWRNGRWENVLGIVTLVVMTLAGLGLLLQ